MTPPKQCITAWTLSSSEIELINRVHAHFPNNNPNKFHFFYQATSPFSNFHPCVFSENDIQFYTSEQYMMYHKAKLFEDNKTAEAILQATHPAEYQALGRTVKNFDRKLWMNNRTRIVSAGLFLKFTQNDHLKQALLKHHGSLLVEAAADDGVWGIGLDEDNPFIEQLSYWTGPNLLGYILTDVLQRIHD